MAEDILHHLSLLVLVITMTTAYRHQLVYTGKMLTIPARVKVSATEKRRFSDVLLVHKSCSVLPPMGKKRIKSFKRCPLNLSIHDLSNELLNP